MSRLEWARHGEAAHTGSTQSEPGRRRSLPTHVLELGTSQLLRSTVRLDGSVPCANEGGMSRLVAAASQPGYDRKRVVVGVGTESLFAVERKF